jgi:hypothetical protein
MILVFITLIFSALSFSETHVVTISQEVIINPGDVIKLKDSPFTVSISLNKGTECAVPGKNCGSGYIPPHLTIKRDCGGNKNCLYFIIGSHNGIENQKLSIETEETCLKKNYEMCFSDYSGSLQSDEGCSSLKTSMGKYFCLKRFYSSNRPENKDLCDKLPNSIYALRWNCYYEYAIRYKDASFCEKYSKEELSGKDRCYLKMAELFKDKNFCSKISDSKEHNYKEQCYEVK